MVVGAVLGERDAESSHVQFADRDGGHRASIPRRVQVEALPDTCVGILRMDRGRRRRQKEPVAHPSAGRPAVLVRGPLARNDKLGITSCTIVTMPAGEPMAKLHDRQPVILKPDVYQEWLDPATPGPKAKALLQDNLDGGLEFHRVSRDVNSSKFEGRPLPEVNPL
jgi:hypothetical protein